MIESEEHKRVDRQKLEATLAQSTQHRQRQRQKLEGQAFACEADARAAAERLARQLTFHQLEHLQVTRQQHYDRAGRPAKGAQPTSLTYHIQASLSLNPVVVA